MKSTEMLLDGKGVRIISLLDITREMDWQEVEAWQKLIRVLTHEIMNSIAPISSLSSTVESMLRPFTSSKKRDSFGLE